MTTQAPQQQKTQAVALTDAGLAAKAEEIDHIASSAMALFEGASSFAAELQVAKSIRDLRAALTPEIMAPIMALMNTDLGFLTDRDPRRPSKQGEETRPYSVDVVRDVLIESKLRGFHTVGNEFNIISARFYAAKNGLKRRCETWPGVTDLKILVGVPKMREGGAIVAVTGSWKKGGVADKIETEIAVRVNAHMGADAIVGKAERKLYKRIFDRLSGRSTPDGDVDDDDLKQAKNVTPAGSPPAQPTPPAPPAPKTNPTPSGFAQGGEVAKAPREPAAVSSAPTRPPGASAGDGEDVRDKLADCMVAQGINWDLFAKYGGMAGWDVPWENSDGYNMLPLELANLIWKTRLSLAAQILAWKQEQGL